MVVRRRVLVWLLVLVCGLGAAARPAPLTSLEQEIVREINLLRTQPGTYAELLEKERGFYRDGLYARPGQTPIKTKEGLVAVDEAIAFLRAQAPVGPLQPSVGMSLGARDHVLDQGPKGGFGHSGSDGSDPLTRISRYGTPTGAGENLAYGPNTARQIVMALVVDDGVADRGHRINFFRPGYQVVGVSVGPHARYRTMCAIDFANAYADDPTRIAAAPEAPQVAVASSTGSSPPATSGTPLQQARSVVEAHFAAAVGGDRTAWLATLGPTLLARSGTLWSQARAAVGQLSGYSYARLEKGGSGYYRFLFLKRDSHGKATGSVAVKAVLDAGRWKVDEVGY